MGQYYKGSQGRGVSMNRSHLLACSTYLNPIINHLLITYQSTYIPDNTYNSQITQLTQNMSNAIRSAMITCRVPQPFFKPRKPSEVGLLIPSYLTC